MDTTNQQGSGVVTATSEQAQARQQSAPDIHVMRELLDVLATITIADDPFGVARNAVTHAITTGEIDGLYTPQGSAEYTVTLTGVPYYIDPRVTLAQWLTWRRAGVNAAETVIAEAEARSLAAGAQLREQMSAAHAEVRQLRAQRTPIGALRNVIPERVARWIGRKAR